MSGAGDHIREFDWDGHVITVDDRLGHLMVQHFGDISWDVLQAIKNEVWGDEARAIEVYPRASEVVNTRPVRHLWRLGEQDFCPDMLGPRSEDDRLAARFTRAWAEAG